MKIVDLSVAILREEEEPYDNRQQCALIMLSAEDGTIGYGEANANPAAVKALLETDLGLVRNLDDVPRRVVLGADAERPTELWRRLKDSTSGRAEPAWVMSLLRRSGPRPGISQASSRASRPTSC